MTQAWYARIMLTDKHIQFIFGERSSRWVLLLSCECNCYFPLPHGTVG